MTRFAFRAWCVLGVFGFAFFANAAAARAQNPGVTKPALEALVANSAEILKVRVKSFQEDEHKYSLERIELEVVGYLKRAWSLPVDAAPVDAAPDAEERPVAGPQFDAATGILSFAQRDAKNLRHYNQYYWGLDMSAPGGSAAELIADAHKEQKELILFKKFQAMEAGEIYLLIDPDKDELVLSDWSVVASREAVQKKIDELLARYRGVETLKLVLIETYYIEDAAKAAFGADTKVPGARAILIPFDATYEKLLVAQMKNRRLLEDNDLTTSRVDWLKYTPDIYHFDTQANRDLVRELIADPKAGTQQKALLEKILKAWESPS